MATILIVDDLSTNRDLLTAVLDHSGHRLLYATDGGEALRIAIAEPPDLVVTDVLMPVMDGYELVKELRARPATANIPIVFYTAHYGQYEARDLAQSMGVAHVITKPFEPADVLRVVTQLLGGTPTTVESGVQITAAQDREHLRLLTDKLSTTTEGLRHANAKLRAMINIGLELASQKDRDRMLQTVCTSARDLFGATYATIGIGDRDHELVQAVVACGVTPDRWLAPGDAIPAMFAPVVRERRVVRGTKPGESPECLGLPPGHPRVDSFLAAPIASPSHVYGWLCLVCNEGTAFLESDESLALALSAQVGRAYENGYLLSGAQARATTLEHEVAERKEAERIARHAGDRAQRYFDTADVMLVALDTDLRITAVNRKACDLLGWSERELLGRDWVETCLPARIRGELASRFGTLLDGDTSTVENAVLTRAGDEILIEWHNTLLRDDAGRVVGTLSSGTDISERSAATAALRVTEERMRFALESADVGIWDMDYVSGALTWSDTIAAHYGVPVGTFAGTFDAFIERVHPADRDSVLEIVGAAMKTGSDFTVENRSIQPDGAIRYLRGAGRILLDADGKLLRGIGISIDDTAHQRLEAQYLQSQKMEAIGRLAGGVAHDFNNLLTAILGYCELLLADFNPEDPRRANLTEIQSAGRSAASLTRQLLTFSRKQLVEPTVLDLNELISGMRALLVRLIGEDVEVVIVLPKDLGFIRADHGQIEQVVMNLAVNARDAMPNGGKLTIQTANVELDEHYERLHIGAKRGQYIALIISDTGTGMSAEVQEHLFEPFFTTKEAGKGTGLGLATVHGIVAGNGGTVKVYSEVGRGTAFTVYLPLVADVAQIAVVAPTIDTRPRPTGETVLLVEDFDALRKLTRLLLEREGYKVLAAANADEAVALFDRNDSIDILLTDVVMPGASGADLTKRLLEKRPTLRAIFMSGYTEEAIIHHGVLNSGIAFLHKPFSSDALMKKIRDTVRH
jgi:two-component system cell cycle sensor histidine kinase/response regulator CckA